VALEEEGGVIVTLQSLGSYLTRIRRKETAKAGAPTPPLTLFLAEAKLPFCSELTRECSGKRQEKADLNILPARQTKAS